MKCIVEKNFHMVDNNSYDLTLGFHSLDINLLPRKV